MGGSTPQCRAAARFDHRYRRRHLGFQPVRAAPGPAGAIPDITRVAVSEHILLGGDNIDLALASLLEPRLAGERGQISGAAMGSSRRLMP